jgi:lysozyme family protein
VSAVTLTKSTTRSKAPVITARFDVAIETILEHEGGLTDHPKDPGGITNYGITLPVLREMGMAGDLDGDGDIDADDIRGMTLAQAKEIYRVTWWDKFKYSTLAPQVIATKLFDGAVNFGWFQGHVIFQRAINMVLEGARLKLDGKLGPKTREAVFQIVCDGLEDELLNSQRVGMGYVYGLIVAKKQELECFHMGWLRRAAW